MVEKQCNYAPGTNTSTTRRSGHAGDPAACVIHDGRWTRLFLELRPRMGSSGAQNRIFGTGFADVQELQRGPASLPVVDIARKRGVSVLRAGRMQASAAQTLTRDGPEGSFWEWRVSKA